MALSKGIPSLPRLVAKLDSQGIASVPMLGRYNNARAHSGLSEHRHRRAMEFCFLLRGQQTYSVGTERFHLRGGDVFMTFPDEEHGTGGEPEEKGLLYWMILLDPAETKGCLLGLPASESRALWQALIRPFPRHFSGTPEMKFHLDAVTRVIHSSSGDLSRITTVNHIIALLLAVVDARQQSLVRTEAGPLQKVLAYINARLEEPEELTVKKLADVAKLSASRFKARFKEEMGMPPAEYTQRMRIKEAARRLATSQATITEVAFALGFSSSQYFATVFKRFTNCTPGQVRLEQRGS